MHGTLRLSSARLLDGRIVDVVLADGRVAEVLPAGSTTAVGHDLSGYLLLGAPAEPHAHLDKTGTWEQVGCVSGELADAVEAWHAFSARITEADLRARAESTLTDLLAHGATAVRTHVDLFPGSDPLLAVRTLVRLRADWARLLDLQVVPLLFENTPDELGAAAVDGGADLIGGCPSLAGDPVAEVHRLMALARRCGVGLDLHIDECLDPASASLAALAEAVTEQGFPYPITASHCVSLGQLPLMRARATAAAVAAAGISVVTLPQTNLYLQGRGTPLGTPRGLTAIGALTEAGVTVAGGGDNIGDPFNPMGRADPLETASLLVTAAHLPVDRAYAAVGADARQVLGLDSAGPVPGHRADLLAIRANGLAEAVGKATEDRLVFRAGVLVSRTTVRREII